MSSTPDSRIPPKILPPQLIAEAKPEANTLEQILGELKIIRVSVLFFVGLTLLNLLVAFIIAGRR